MFARTIHRILATVGIALLAGPVLGACSSTHFVNIRHPLHVGQVDPNEVPFEAGREEGPRGLPGGTLTDTASLTEVTPERICARVKLWTLDEVDVTRGDFNNYRISMLNDQDGVEVSNAQVQLETPVTQAYNGVIQQRIQDGYERYCVRRTNRGACVRYGTRPRYRTVNVPHVWQVTSHPAQLCFANQGFVTPSTTRVSIEMDGQGPGSMTFQWQFDSAVAAAPAQQQQQ